MANLPQSFTMNDASFGTLSPGASSSQSAADKINMASAEQLVLELSNPDLRENALRVLSKAAIAILRQQYQGFRSLRNHTATAIAAVLIAISRNIKDHDRTNLFPELAPLLWNSFGTIAAILQEIISTYPVLSPPNLTHVQSTRVCNALALLQCVASHPDTKMPFLKAHIPLYLYPFLNTTNMSGQFEHLRLASLGVIGALVKVNNRDVICFLLSTEIVPLCLRNMEIGREMAKTVATFILQKIVSDDVGLEYVCATAERFFAVERVLKMVMASLENEPSPRLMKLVLPTYYRLSNNRRACDALRSCLPDMLRDANFSSYLREDPTSWMWLQQLLENVGVDRVPSPRAGGGIDHIVAS